MKCLKKRFVVAFNQINKKIADPNNAKKHYYFYLNIKNVNW